MDKLSQTFLDSCRRDNGRILRGENMTRIETFVDAAFAFAFTMLVISIDEIPRSPSELFLLSRDIPAFIISAGIVGSIWLTHATWSRTFGLQDGVTILLSLGLVMLVLVFVYPIKLVIQATVVYLSVTVLGTTILETAIFENEGWANGGVASLFTYFSLGFMVLSAIIILLYLNSLRHRQELVLSHYEIYFCKRAILGWIVVAVTAVLSCIIALVVDDQYSVYAGYTYFSLCVTMPLAQRIYRRRQPEHSQL